MQLTVEIEQVADGRWLAEAPELLSPAARRAIQNERKAGVLGVSDMTLLELARIVSHGKVIVSTSLEAFLRSVEANFSILPLTSAIAARTISFSTAYPKDPVDRVVGATAIVHSGKLVTKDDAIRESGEVKCIW